MMDEKNLRNNNLRNVDVDNLRHILEHRFPPPSNARQSSTTRHSRVSLLENEETPWWWSSSGNLQPYGRESRVLDTNHLLSSEMLARSLALSAQRARDKLYPFVVSLAKQRGEDYNEMIDAWDGFGLDFMPRIPKQPGCPPHPMYFYKARIEKDIQNIHLVLQYFAVLLEEIVHDHERFKSPSKQKWLEITEMLKQLLREVDVMLVTLELPRRRVPRAAVPGYARCLELHEARDARDWLAARDLLNAVELLWHVFSLFAAATDARREAQLRASGTSVARHWHGQRHHHVSYSSLPTDDSGSAVILPYARLSPLPGRPVGAAEFLYGEPHTHLSTPSSASPTHSFSQNVTSSPPFPPHTPQSRTSFQQDSPSYPPQTQYVFHVPRTGSPPSPCSPPRTDSPPSTVSRHRHPRTVLPSSPPRSDSPPYPASDSPTPATHTQTNQSAGAPECCKPPPRSQPPPFIPSSPPPLYPLITRYLTTPVSDSPNPAVDPLVHLRVAVSPCCLPPPTPQLPPPDCH